MNFEKAMLIIVCVLISLTVLSALTGCGLFQRRGNWLEEKTPETPKDALWQTVKKAKDNLFTTMAIPIVAAGVAIVWLGFRKIGVACMLFGFTNLVMALASARFAFWMALFGFVGTIAALAASILAKNKAVKELVGNIQKVKGIIPEADNRLRDAKTILSKQAKSTKKIVKRIKTKMLLKEMKLKGDA